MVLILNHWVVKCTFLFVQFVGSMLLIGPPTLVLVAAGAVLLVAARGGGHGGAAGWRRAADDSDSEDEVSFQTYDDPDDSESPVPPFEPSSTTAFKLPGYYTKGSLARAYSFFKLFFTDNMINSIVDHTNSSAQEKPFSDLGSSYTFSDGSWQHVTANEIRRFIAILIHFAWFTSEVMSRRTGVRRPFPMVSGPAQSFPARGIQQS